VTRIILTSLKKVLLSGRNRFCGFIDKGQIDLDTGIDIWELERSKITIDRTNDKLSTTPKLVL
jgi:hypothetical protein